ncbi:hypothetical protein D3C72_2391580 [compost metagenome]
MPINSLHHHLVHDDIVLCSLVVFKQRYSFSRIAGERRHAAKLICQLLPYTTKKLDGLRCVSVGVER